MPPKLDYVVTVQGVGVFDYADLPTANKYARELKTDYPTNEVNIFKGYTRKPDSWSLVKRL